jgi:uncharacterized integral membrane protein
MNKTKLTALVLLYSLSSYAQRLSDIEDLDSYEPISDNVYIIYFGGILVILFLIFIIHNIERIIKGKK